MADSGEGRPGGVAVADEHPQPSTPSTQEQEAVLKKRYGGLIPKKPPLISKDHERAFFDSADWALGKGTAPGMKPRSSVESLRPKLQPTPHQPLPSRRASYIPSAEEMAGEAGAEVETPAN